MTEDLTRRSRDRVDDLAARLRDDHGEFRTVEKEWRHPPGFYESLVERFEAGHAGGAGGWIYDDDGRVLLAKDEGTVGWMDPGGKREPGESFEEAARREIREETGGEVTLTGVLELHRITVYDGTDRDRPHLLEPIVIFEARYEGGDPEPTDGEIEAVEWFESTPDAVGYEEVRERPIPFDPD
ncbi:ADP-ribose pyrophosphatase [Halobacteriales archaeon QS_8_69_26]|nr:MAG: ADP-ribose pyrophosphatase [Halobacteriales archaeon QS_8_69_26]